MRLEHFLTRIKINHSWRWYQHNIRVEVTSTVERKVMTNFEYDSQRYKLKMRQNFDRLYDKLVGFIIELKSQENHNQQVHCSVKWNHAKNRFISYSRIVFVKLCCFAAWQIRVKKSEHHRRINRKKMRLRWAKPFFSGSSLLKWKAARISKVVLC